MEVFESKLSQNKLIKLSVLSLVLFVLIPNVAILLQPPFGYDISWHQRMETLLLTDVIILLVFIYLWFRHQSRHLRKVSFQDEKQELIIEYYVLFSGKKQVHIPYEQLAYYYGPHSKHDKTHSLCFYVDREYIGETTPKFFMVHDWNEEQEKSMVEKLSQAGKALIERRRSINEPMMRTFGIIFGIISIILLITYYQNASMAWLCWIIFPISLGGMTAGGLGKSNFVFFVCAFVWIFDLIFLISPWIMFG